MHSSQLASYVGMGLRNPLAVQLSDLLTQLYSVGASLVPAQHASVPPLKSLSVAPSLQYLVTVQFSAHTTSPKSQRFLTFTAGHSLPPLDPGSTPDHFGRSCSLFSVSLCLSLSLSLMSPSSCLWLLQVGIWLAVCSVDLPDSIYPLKSTGQGLGVLCVVLGPSALGGKGATKLIFLSGLSTAAGSIHGIFPLQPIKSPYCLL